MTKRQHAEFMVETLGPDLQASGRVHTAKDVIACGRMVLAGQKSKSYARWLKSTLVPDLRKSGMVETAKDLARCARSIG
jgi:hypothetical protein